MPVVELRYSRLQKLIGKIPRKHIADLLPFLGLDIEYEDKDIIRVEYSPNRPDYSTEYGIALGLQGLSGIKTGIVNLRVKKRSRCSVSVTSKVGRIRPYVTGIIARDSVLDDATIRQIMAMQEDLHFGIGRRRTKAAIGIHDLDRILFPVTYTTVSRNHKFVPLDSEKELDISQILEDTNVGRTYGRMLKEFTNVPVILDSAGNTVSFPPIVNAAATTLTPDTKNLFVEVTGMNKTDIEHVLSVIALVLQTAGFSLETLKISGGRNSTFEAESREITTSPNLVSQTLGLELGPSRIASCLKKARLGATVKNGLIVCSIPPHRFDILGPMDLVEEAALGYGIGNFKPVLPPAQTIGQYHPVARQLKATSLLMVGLGYTEALNSSLTSSHILCKMTNQPDKSVIPVQNSKSQEHMILRDAILPGLIENLSRNIHATYPQRLFESGTVFGTGSPIDETVNLGCVSAHGSASFTEIKSALQSVLKTGFGMKIQTKAAAIPMFEDGRAAYVAVDNRNIGVIGEISSLTRSGYKIRVPVAGFEISLSGLIFD